MTANRQNKKSPRHRTGARINARRQFCQPRYPDVATAGHAKAALRQSATSEQRGYLQCAVVY